MKLPSSDLYSRCPLMNRSFTFLFAIAVGVALSGCVSVPPADLTKRQQAIATHGTAVIPGERIGPVSLGMTTADLLAVLGEPDEKKERKSRKVPLFISFVLFFLFESADGVVDIAVEGLHIVKIRLFASKLRNKIRKEKA